MGSKQIQLIDYSGFVEWQIAPYPFCNADLKVRILRKLLSTAYVLFGEGLQKYFTILPVPQKTSLWPHATFQD